MQNNSGITMIALAITMIIMIILATISVTVLSGDNSLIKKAEEAKQDTDVKQEEDIINQAVYQAMNNNRYGELDKTELENALNSIAGKDKEGNNKVTVTLNGNKFKAYFTDSGRCYTIDSNGKAEKQQP